MQASVPSTSARGWRWFAPLIVFAAVLACYWPALSGALLWDDPAHVTRPDLRSLHGLFRIWFELGATQQYYPVLHSAFWLEHHLWGDAVLGYHLLNVLLHAANSCLFAGVLRWLWDWSAGAPSSRRIPVGTEWIVALAFAVHPVAVESVAWISEQKNTLSLFFYLLAAQSYLTFRLEQRPRSYWLAGGLFLLALGTKTVTATLPAALLVVLWWKNGRLTWRQDVRPLLPWFAVGLVAGLTTAWVERKYIGAEGAAFELTLLQRALLAGRVVWFYAGKLVWPAEISFFYPRWDATASMLAWSGYLAAAIALTAGLWARRRRAPGLLAGWLLYGGSLFPALGFFNVYPFAFSYVADHFQYLASISLMGTLGGSAGWLVSASPRRVRGLAVGLSGVVVLLFGVRAMQESRLYRDNETLMRATLAQVPDSWIAHQILAVALSKTPGREAESIPHYEEVIRLNPSFPESYHGLGVELARQPGRRPEVIALYRRSLELRPNFIEAHNNLGVELTTSPATLPEAIVHFQTVLGLQPQHAGAHVNLANALAQMPDRRAEAISHFEAALRLRPTELRARNGLAHLLAQMPGRLDEAIGHGQAAIEIQPASPEAHYHLANAFAVAPGRQAEAMREYEIAVQLQPRYAPAHFGLANLLARDPSRVTEAIRHYEAAIQNDPRFLEARINLANLLASMPERREQAVAHYQEVLRINPKLAWVHHNLALTLAADPAQHVTAIHHCEEALRLQPDYLEAMNSLGILHAQQGDVARARALWVRALQLDPQFEPARQNLRLLEQAPPP